MNSSSNSVVSVSYVSKGRPVTVTSYGDSIMELEINPLCVVCGEPATKAPFGYKDIYLCSLSACEVAVLNEVNQLLDDAYIDNNEGAQP